MAWPPRPDLRPVRRAQVRGLLPVRAGLPGRGDRHERLRLHREADPLRPAGDLRRAEGSQRLPARRPAGGADAQRGALGRGDRHALAARRDRRLRRPPRGAGRDLLRRRGALRLPPRARAARGERADVDPLGADLRRRRARRLPPPPRRWAPGHRLHLRRLPLRRRRGPAGRRCAPTWASSRARRPRTGPSASAVSDEVAAGALSPALRIDTMVYGPLTVEQGACTWWPSDARRRPAGAPAQPVS